MSNNKKLDQSISLSSSKYILITKILKNIHDNLGKVIEILEHSPEEIESMGDSLSGIENAIKDINQDLESAGEGKIIEGVFDGVKMIGEDGSEFTVPANYASKSKLVEGDILKLTITKKGDFKFKQIGPVERDRLVGELIQDSKGEFAVKVDKKKWKVLPASVTYFKGDLGDEAVILVPKGAQSKWAAVENIVKH